VTIILIALFTGFFLVWEQYHYSN